MQDKHTHIDMLSIYQRLYCSICYFIAETHHLYRWLSFKVQGVCVCVFVYVCVYVCECLSVYHISNDIANLYVTTVIRITFVRYGLL